ncbi:MAG: PepSY domain-containing protein [Aristaeellaceae bacterium]
MKKITALLLTMLLALPLTALATEDAALEQARTMVSATAALTERETEDGLTEFEFREDAQRWDVVLDAANQPVRYQVEYTDVKGAAEAELDGSVAGDIALATLQDEPGAYVAFTLLEKDDGLYRWKVFARSGEDWLVYELNAQDGGVMETERYFAAAAVTPEETVEAIRAQKGEIVLTELDLELDKGRLVYEGQAELGGVRYEFEVLASDGSLIEWKKD